jgi:uncharacterized protein YbjT (DUF2867 family)
MKIVVIGGDGLIGSRLVEILRARGHTVASASPRSGVNTITGEGLAGAVAGADVVVDVTNSPSFADDDVMRFFATSTANQLAAERAASVGHHVALSVVGSERMMDSGYFRAKVKQEELIEQGGVPYSILRATQFFEFLGKIADGSADGGGAVRVAPVEMQPLAARDVSAALADVACAAPINGRAEVSGPERFHLDEAVQHVLRARGDERPVIGDPATTYFGTRAENGALLAGTGARIAATRLDDWLGQTAH